MNGGGGSAVATLKFIVHCNCMKNTMHNIIKRFGVWGSRVMFAFLVFFVVTVCGLKCMHIYDCLQLIQ